MFPLKFGYLPAPQVKIAGVGPYQVVYQQPRKQIHVAPNTKFCVFLK